MCTNKNLACTKQPANGQLSSPHATKQIFTNKNQIVETISF